MRPSSSIARPEQHTEAGAGAEVDLDLDHEVGGRGDVGERPALVGPAHDERHPGPHLDQRQCVAELPVGAGGHELLDHGACGRRLGLERGLGYGLRRGSKCRLDRRSSRRRRRSSGSGSASAAAAVGGHDLGRRRARRFEGAARRRRERGSSRSKRGLDVGVRGSTARVSTAVRRRSVAVDGLATRSAAVRRRAADGVEVSGADGGHVRWGRRASTSDPRRSSPVPGSASDSVGRWSRHVGRGAPTPAASVSALVGGRASVSGVPQST